MNTRIHLPFVSRSQSLWLPYSNEAKFSSNFVSRKRPSYGKRPPRLDIFTCVQECKLMRFNAFYESNRHHNVTKIPIIHVFVIVFVSLHVDI